MADKKPWQSQLPGGGNNIPESYLRKLGLRGETGKRDDDPEDGDLARFIRDEL
jgi:hypothetical protein